MLHRTFERSLGNIKRFFSVIEIVCYNVQIIVDDISTREYADRGIIFIADMFSDHLSP
jgi:hypothetical protein